MKVSGFSFHSLDLPLAGWIYSELFGWKIVSSSLQHLEMSIGDGECPLLYFSPAEGICPTDPGTITLSMDAYEINKLMGSSIWKDHFRAEYTDPRGRYNSWLDDWDNRIWIYLKS